VILEQTIGVGLADGGIAWDIPPAAIPIDLRPIGSRFEVIYWENDESESTEANRAFKIEVVRT
jgi:hypothetical protein